MYRFIVFFLVLTFCNKFAISREIPYLQAVHVLDPGIEDFKYYMSWNSDKWINWVRHRYIENELQKKKTMELGESSISPLYGLWVNIIIISNMDDINSAFTELSNKTYPGDVTRQDFYWSDVPFLVYAVVRKPSSTLSSESDTTTTTVETENQYNVYSCSEKRMFINAKLDTVTLKPILIQTFFPKKVKNPKDKLRIPLITCKKVSRVRGLLDEIKFQLGS